MLVKRSLPVWTLAILSIFTSGVSASADKPTIGVNVLDKFNIKPELKAKDYNLFGDKFDPVMGNISFTQTDLNIPGNFSLPVKIERTLSGPDGWFADSKDFASWSLVIPHIRSTVLADNEGNIPKDHGGWALGTACSRPLGPGDYNLSVGGKIFRVREKDYWAGDTIVIPGVGDEKILVDGDGIKTTSNGWEISCIDTAEGYEGFKVIDNNANTYYFSKLKYIKSLKSVDVSEEQKGSAGAPPSQPTFPGADNNPFFISLVKYTAFLMPSKIVDKHGNYVDYIYDGNKLKKIESSDGRVITIYYNENNYISSVSDGEHTYNYTYDTNAITTLSQVTRPDGRSWKFQHPKEKNESGYRFWNFATIGSHTQMPIGTGCLITDDMTGVFVKMISPEGEQATFSARETYHGRTEIETAPRPVPRGWNPGDMGYYDSNCMSMISFYNKTVQDIDGSMKSWNYDYSSNRGAYKSQRGQEIKLDFDISFSGLNADDFKSTTINNPDGTREKYFFSRKFGWDENKLYAQEYINKNGVVVRLDKYNYFKGKYTGRSNVYRDEVSSQKIKEKLRTEIITDDDGTKDTFYKEVVSFTDFDEPKITHYYNDFSDNNLWEKSLYFSLNSIHLLNVVSGSELSSNNNQWKEKDRITFYSNGAGIGEMLNYYKFGELISTNYYNNDGTLKKTTYNGSGRYEQYGDYFRGKPKKITLPCSLTNGCNTVNGSSSNTIAALLSINDDGTIKSFTDFNGNKVDYSYNSLGWLKKIDYADPKWQDYNIDYSIVTAPNDGLSGSDIPVGSLHQTITKGNYKKDIYHDGLLRPLFIAERDMSNTSSVRYKSFEYDLNNKVTFESFWGGKPSTINGNKIEYDVLGRIIRKTRTSDNRKIEKSYLSNNRVAETDGEGNVTTTSFLAFGVHEYDSPTFIAAPDTDNISISYNEFRQLTAISQGNITENRIYDKYQQLCKTVRPETGVTAFGYNKQGQVIWHAEGSNGSKTTCDPEAVLSSQKTLIGYDNQGNLHTEKFPDGNTDRSYSYDGNGNLTRLSAGNVVWEYKFNSLNLPESETLNLDSKHFVLSWKYNSLGAVSSLEYPSGASVEFSPNALGQPTKAGSYAIDVSYFPNGKIKQFTYGNGIVRSVQQDSTGRMSLLTDMKSGNLRNKLEPNYDHNDNLTQLLDFVDRNYDVTGLRYDGVNRLLAANGKWGRGSFSYDGLGNLLSRTFNNSTIGYQYNSRNLLNNLTGAYAYSYQYDSRGNVTNNGRFGLSYNRAQQMVGAKSITYEYDGFNRKVKKTNSSGNAYTIYSKKGQLLYRIAPDGTQTDSIYLGRQIVAEVDR